MLLQKYMDSPFPKGTSYPKGDWHSFMREDSPIAINFENYLQIEQLKTFCDQFEKSDKFLEVNSYQLKKLYEHQHAYVCNGAFKGAMLLAGFEAEDDSELNWCFNISKSSYENIRKDIRKKEHARSKGKVYIHSQLNGGNGMG